MEVKFVPTMCVASKDQSGADVPPIMEGFIVCEPLKYPQRMRLKGEFAKMQRDDADGKAVSAEVMQERINMLAEMSEKVKANILRCELTDLKSGEKALTCDDLFDNPVFESALSETVVAFVMGFRPNS